MRLSPDQLTRIRHIVRSMTSPQADHELRVFGSILNDAARGGDVDLYLEIAGLPTAERARLQRRLRVALEEALDLPVDLVVQDRAAPLKLVSQIAKSEGMRL